MYTSKAGNNTSFSRDEAKRLEPVLKENLRESQEFQSKGDFHEGKETSPEALPP